MRGHLPLSTPASATRDWVLDDPAGQDLNHVRPIRNDTRRRVEKLIAELLPGT
jgi:arsenate reductase